MNEAIDWIKALSEFNPYWIEEPTHPDDVVGHRQIARAVHPLKIASGEHAHNQVMFKQLLQERAIHFCQIDACRLAGVNENLAVMLMADHAGIAVCPHAGGVGLCEYVQHLSMIDYVCVSATMEGRVIEHAGTLHHHFENPIQISEGRYLAPTSSGFSVDLKPKSIDEFRFPDGTAWAS